MTPLRLVIAALAAAALAVALWLALRPAPQPQAGLSGEGRVVFTRAAVEACVKAQGEVAENSGLTPAAISTFCGCYGDRLADAMTPDDVDRLAKLPKDKIVAAQEDKADEAFQACSGSIDDAPKP